jgi:hypothetical protein
MPLGTENVLVQRKLPLRHPANKPDHTDDNTPKQLYRRHRVIGMTGTLKMEDVETIQQIGVIRIRIEIAAEDNE